MQAAKGSRLKETPHVEYMASAKPFVLPKLVTRVQAALPETQEIYLVGGAVRDVLLGRQPHDLDFAVAGNAVSLGRKLADSLSADFYVLDAERGAARLILTSDGERSTLDVLVLQGANIDGDLAARDVTINAMAIDLRQPQALLDPLGGASDLIAKRVRAASPDAFRDDPVRILRAVRMAATFEMNIEGDTRERMRAAVTSLPSISPERLRDELFRLLGAPQVRTSLRALDLLGALEQILPEIQLLKGLTQSSPHVFDAWEHTLQVVAKLSLVFDLLGARYSAEGAGDLQAGLVALRLGRYRRPISQQLGSFVVPERPRSVLLTFAALLHDSGKASTRSVGDDGRIHFYEHETSSAELADERAKALHLSNDEREILRVVIANHMRPMQLTLTGELPSRRAIYRFFRDTGAAGVDICLLSLADLLGKYGAELPEKELSKHLDTLRALLEAYFERPQESVKPPILLNGDDLMGELGIEPGPKVGEILDALGEAQAAGEVNDRAQALAFAQALLAQP